MTYFDIDDMEVMSFSSQKHDGCDSWCEVQLREPRSLSKPYLMKKWSIYLTQWDGQRTGVYLTPKQARKIATWLISAADIIEERNKK